MELRVADAAGGDMPSFALVGPQGRFLAAGGGPALVDAGRAAQR